MGTFSSCRNCLRLCGVLSGCGLAIRVPRPAAGKMTATFIMKGSLICYCMPDSTGSGTFGGVNPVVVTSKDHFPRGGLQDACDGDLNGLGDQLSGVIDNDHGAVVEIRDSLIELLALFQDEDFHSLAGQDDGLHR